MGTFYKPEFYGYYPSDIRRLYDLDYLDRWNYWKNKSTAVVQISQVDLDNAKLVNNLFDSTLKKLLREKQMKIRKVIYNDPATVVIWSDGTKTVCKVMEGETYDRQTGFLMCIAKAVFGKNFRKIMKQYAWNETEEHREKE